MNRRRWNADISMGEKYDTKGEDCIRLVHDNVQRRTFMNMVMNVWVP